MICTEEAIEEMIPKLNEMLSNKKLTHKEKETIKATINLLKGYLETLKGEQE